MRAGESQLSHFAFLIPLLGCNRERECGYSSHARSPSKRSRLAEVAWVYGDRRARAGAWNRLY
jgi:hypothetical protein